MSQKSRVKSHELWVISHTTTYFTCPTHLTLDPKSHKSWSSQMSKVKSAKFVLPHKSQVMSHTRQTQINSIWFSGVQTSTCTVHVVSLVCLPDVINCLVLNSLDFSWNHSVGRQRNSTIHHQNVINKMFEDLKNEKWEKVKDERKWEKIHCTCD